MLFSNLGATSHRNQYNQELDLQNQKLIFYVTNFFCYHKKFVSIENMDCSTPKVLSPFHIQLWHVSYTLFYLSL